MRFIPLNFTEHTGPKLRLCEQEGCEAAGEFRAPKSPYHLREYYWFCLEHVRDYNKAWDFYRGMSSDEIEASRASDMTWNRPSWPIGNWSVLLEKAQYLDGVDSILKSAMRAPSLPPDVQKALKVLDLTLPFTLEVLKKQYKKFVKRHHPDLHAGDKQAEERLKVINEAYQIIKKHLG